MSYIDAIQTGGISKLINCHCHYLLPSPVPKNFAEKIGVCVCMAGGIKKITPRNEFEFETKDPLYVKTKVDFKVFNVMIYDIC